MLSPDLQRIKHICDYCNEIEKTMLDMETHFKFLIMIQIIRDQFHSQLCRLAS